MIAVDGSQTTVEMSEIDAQSKDDRCQSIQNRTALTRAFIIIITDESRNRVTDLK